MFHRSAIRLSIAATSVVGTLAGAALIAAPADAATAAPATQSAGCPTGQLPSSVLGNPGIKPGESAGVYLGHGTGSTSEKVGYGLAVTHPGGKAAVFTGTIRASAPITAVKVRDERHDVVRLSADHRTMTFRFIDYGGIDGVAFRADCAKTVGVSLAENGKRLPTSSVFLGAHRVHPTSDPFTIERS